MKNWLTSLISINKAIKQHPDMAIQQIFSEIASGSLVPYYLIPPHRYASERPVETYRLVTDEDYGTSLTVWAGGHDISGPCPLPIKNSAQLIEEALYKFVTDGGPTSLKTSIDRRRIELKDGERVLIPARWPLIPAALGEERFSHQTLDEMFTRQYPDAEQPFIYREVDNTQITAGDLMIPVEFLASASGTPSGIDQVRTSEGGIAPRERDSFLNIIWVFLQLTIEKSQNPNANQTMIREELIELQEKFGGMRGVSRAKLDEIFAEANKLNKHRKR
ncbi:hypothetical protein [Microbulbifer mangrovi]|uniref:hypothetical protein n=1 Tax=Microbulbifer mangrovi TaxID=927787 RepID=UPI00099050B9|nr:hypothetical protein [Microbulbifer mangrovi]